METPTNESPVIFWQSWLRKKKYKNSTLGKQSKAQAILEGFCPWRPPALTETVCPIHEMKVLGAIITLTYEEIAQLYPARHCQ
jgi:hypothetical protein